MTHNAPAPWFSVTQIDERTYAISEAQHWENTHCYLLNGDHCSLLIDTGLGIADISGVVKKLTGKPVAAAATHIHWDHIGGHRYFPDFYAHAAELDWLTGKFPLPLSAVKSMVADRCILPDGFNISNYHIFQGTPSRLLEDQDIIDLGGRQIQVLHTPGHSPGHLCFWEKDSGYLFTGDLVYQGMLFANYPSTSPHHYLLSLEKIAELPVRRIFPGHHALDIRPEIVHRMLKTFRHLKDAGSLHHGSGCFHFDDWGIAL